MGGESIEGVLKEKLITIFDSKTYETDFVIDRDAYSKIVTYCIEWIKSTLGLKLFSCEHTETIKIMNDIQNTEVRMYK